MPPVQHVISEIEKQRTVSGIKTDSTGERRKDKQTDHVGDRTDTETGRQTGGQLRAVTDGMRGMSTHAVTPSHTHTQTHIVPTTLPTRMPGKETHQCVCRTEQLPSYASAKDNKGLRFHCILRCHFMKSNDNVFFLNYMITNWIERLFSCWCEYAVQKELR